MGKAKKIEIEKSENRIQQNPKIDFYLHCKRNKKK